jgi:acetyltransferase-like isoleucine patch superfamily enzyme
MVFLMKKRSALNKKWTFPTIRNNKPTEYGWIVSHSANFFLERGTDIGAFTYIQAQEGVEVREFAQIGSHCFICSISTIDGQRSKVVSGRNARIGSHSVIIPGVKIGPNTVV